MTFSAKPHDTSRGGTRGQGWAGFTQAHSVPIMGKVQPHENEHTAFMHAQCRSNAFGIKLTDQVAGTARLSQLRPSSTISSWHNAALSSSVLSYCPSVDIALKLSLVFAATSLGQPKRQVGPSFPPPSQFSDETHYFFCCVSSVHLLQKHIPCLRI